MGRLPCCDKVNIKKGPWTPEEDIILVSYIQEHGPGKWKSVPTNTGKVPETFSIPSLIGIYLSWFSVWSGTCNLPWSFVHLASFTAEEQ